METMSLEISSLLGQIGIDAQIVEESVPEFEKLCRLANSDDFDGVNLNLGQRRRLTEWIASRPNYQQVISQIASNPNPNNSSPSTASVSYPNMTMSRPAATNGGPSLSSPHNGLQNPTISSTGFPVTGGLTPSAKPFVPQGMNNGGGIQQQQQQGGSPTSASNMIAAGGGNQAHHFQESSTYGSIDTSSGDAEQQQLSLPDYQPNPIYSANSGYYGPRSSTAAGSNDGSGRGNNPNNRGGGPINNSQRGYQSAPNGRASPYNFPGYGMQGYGNASGGQAPSQNRGGYDGYDDPSSGPGYNNHGGYQSVSDQGQGQQPGSPSRNSQLPVQYGGGGGQSSQQQQQGGGNAAATDEEMNRMITMTRSMMHHKETLEMLLKASQTEATLSRKESEDLARKLNQTLDTLAQEREAHARSGGGSSGGGVGSSGGGRGGPAGTGDESRELLNLRAELNLMKSQLNAAKTAQAKAEGELTKSRIAQRDMADQLDRANKEIHALRGGGNNTAAAGTGSGTGGGGYQQQSQVSPTGSTSTSSIPAAAGGAAASFPAFRPRASWADDGDDGFDHRPHDNLGGYYGGAAESRFATKTYNGTTNNNNNNNPAYTVPDRNFGSKGYKESVPVPSAPGTGTGIGIGSTGMVVVGKSNPVSVLPKHLTHPTFGHGDARHKTTTIVVHGHSMAADATTATAGSAASGSLSSSRPYSAAGARVTTGPNNNIGGNNSSTSSMMKMPLKLSRTTTATSKSASKLADAKALKFATKLAKKATTGGATATAAAYNDDADYVDYEDLDDNKTGDSYSENRKSVRRGSIGSAFSDAAAQDSNNADSPSSPKRSKGPADQYQPRSTSITAAGQKDGATAVTTGLTAPRGSVSGGIGSGLTGTTATVSSYADRRAAKLAVIALAKEEAKLKRQLEKLKAKTATALLKRQEKFLAAASAATGATSSAPGTAEGAAVAAAAGIKGEEGGSSTNIKNSSISEKKAAATATDPAAAAASSTGAQQHPQRDDGDDDDSGNDNDITAATAADDTRKTKPQTVTKYLSYAERKAAKTEAILAKKAIKLEANKAKLQQKRQARAEQQQQQQQQLLGSLEATDDRDGNEHPRERRSPKPSTASASRTAAAVRDRVRENDREDKDKRESKESKGKDGGGSDDVTDPPAPERVAGSSGIPCRFFRKGYCMFGSKCMHVHAKSEGEKPAGGKFGVKSGVSKSGYKKDRETSGTAATTTTGAATAATTAAAGNGKASAGGGGNQEVSFTVTLKGGNNAPTATATATAAATASEAPIKSEPKGDAKNEGHHHVENGSASTTANNSTTDKTATTATTAATTAATASTAATATVAAAASSD